MPHTQIIIDEIKLLIQCLAVALVVATQAHESVENGEPTDPLVIEYNELVERVQTARASICPQVEAVEEKLG